MNLPERLLWRELRQTEGLKFRRQHPVGRFVIDFYCAAAKLGIEIDGIAHDRGDRPERDEARTAFLETQRIGIIRISAREVLADPSAVAELVAAECRKRIG